MPVNFDNFLSEKPIDLILLNSPNDFGSPLFFKIFSSLTNSFIWLKNQGSIFDSDCILLIEMFFLNASATNSSLFGIFFFNSLKISVFL